MSLSQILGTALSGLDAAQAGLRSVSTNIANAGTAGYARERVATTTNVVAGRGAGVVVGEPQRVADRFLERASYAATGDAARAGVVAEMLGRLDALLGAPDSASGIAALLGRVESEAALLAASDGGALAQGALREAAGDALGALERLGGDIAGLTGEASAELATGLTRANELLGEIHVLNDAVARGTATDQATAGPESRRAALVEELAGLVALDVRAQVDGRLNLDLPGGRPLLDRQLRLFDTPDHAEPVALAGSEPLRLRFANGAATGDTLDAAALGGRLGGLLELRDGRLPALASETARMAQALAGTLNAASSAGTPVPAPNVLAGRTTGLVGSDPAHLNGTIVLAVIDRAGTVISRAAVDFSAYATLDDALGAINSALGGAASAALSDGRLALTATNPAHGVALAAGEPPARRGGTDFAHFFGLNALVETGAAAPGPGLAAGDPHGFAPGETAHLVLRDTTGRLLGEATLAPQPGGTWGDLVSALNGGPLGAQGSFALAEDGRIAFTPRAGSAGGAISIISDATNRHGTGASFTLLSGLAPHQATPPRLRPDSGPLPLALLDPAALPGMRALGAGDLRGAEGLVRALRAGAGGAGLEMRAAALLGGIGADAAAASQRQATAEARRADAAQRRDAFGAVNIDEELAQMVVLQNSYGAAARIITTANQMYDTLLGMTR